MCTYDLYKIDVITGEKKCIKKNISSVPTLYNTTEDGNTYYIDKNYCLYCSHNAEITQLYKFERYVKIIAIIDNVVYFDYEDQNDAYLYKLDLTTGQTEMLDSHIAAGGGGYFNW